ncbi:hypothetical protein FDECE_4500 [Fusarium decemcellulare]|nr:hypothetical protein FDECE_4500 [Fusarium decemcellulare]
MPALSLTALADASASSGAVLAAREAANNTHEALQVICAWPVSGQYGTGTRVLYYVLIATCLLARREEWLVNPCLAAALVLPAVAAIHGIVLAAMHNPHAVDMDIFGAFQLCAIGIVAAPVTVMMSRTYFNDPGRNTIFLWMFLLLSGLLSMAIEFYRIQTKDCWRDADGNPVSLNPAEFPYMEGNNCGITCSVQDGPRSSMRGGSANNIYVIPAPDKLTFGAATLLAAACCIHAILCMVSMWDKVLEINWKRHFGRQEEEPEDKPISGTNGATPGMMKKVNQTIGYFLKILAVPVFGGAGLAILIIGETNFFSRQVDYQTEPMANIGQWAPVVGTAMAMLGSLYLLMARHVHDEHPYTYTHHCNCSHCHLGHNHDRSRSPHRASSISLHSHQDNRSVHSALADRNNHLSPALDPYPSRSSASLRTQDASGDEDNPPPKRNPIREKIEGGFYRIGKILGTPAEDFITQPKSRKKHRVDLPLIPGERFRNERVSGVENEREQQEEEENSPPRSRASSFISSAGSNPNITRSSSLPTAPQPAVLRGPQPTPRARKRSTSLDPEVFASSPYRAA